MHQQIEIGANIARYRREQGLSGEQLAARAGNGLTRSVIANLENGRKRDVTVTQLIALGLALGVSPANLLFDLRRPYEAVELGDLPEGAPKAASWLAYGWFGGQLEIQEMAAAIDGDVFRPSGPEETNQLIFDQLAQRDTLRTRERYTLAQLDRLRRGDDYDAGSAGDPGWTAGGSSVENLNATLSELRRQLDSIDRFLRAYGVDPSLPHVSRGSYF